MSLPMHEEIPGAAATAVENLRATGVEEAPIARFCRERGLVAPQELVTAYALNDPQLTSLRYSPTGDGAEATIENALDIARRSHWPLPANLIPLLPADDASFACVVTAALDRPQTAGQGAVVRWHLDIDRAEHQAELLDTAADLYVDSVIEELTARPIGLSRMLDEIGPAYELNYLDRSERPRGHIVRPVRIACQNVIIGLAAFAQDAGIDGMSVVAWQTCEAAHVATHEGNRALAALMLCDAFQRGGTMEIRFDRAAEVSASGVTRSGRALTVDARYPGHPEMKVPAALRRYGRSVGVELGAKDPAAISPAEARELFLAVTRMPHDLRRRADRMIERGVVSTERLCHSLLAAVWSEIELDFIAATSARAGAILTGGSDWWNRPARQSESEVCRAAAMLGMFHRRLDSIDVPASDGVAHSMEDRRRGVTWQVEAETGAVRFCGLPAGETMPWIADRRRLSTSTLTVFPRSMVSEAVAAQAITRSAKTATALIVPAGIPLPPLPDSVCVLRCPDRLGDIDSVVESKLSRARLSSR